MPIPADPVVALLPVTQADREAAAGWIGGSPYDVVKAEAEMIRIGQLDNHRLVQAFARHRTPAPASGDVRETPPVAQDSIQCFTCGERVKTTSAGHCFTCIKSHRVATPPTPDSSAVSGSAEGLRGNLPDNWQFWLTDAIGILRSNGSDMHVDELCAIRAALTEGQQS